MKHWAVLIDNLKPNNDKQFVCIKEPVEFINLFSSCNGQDECRTLFQQLLDSRDPTQ